MGISIGLHLLLTFQMCYNYPICNQPCSCHLVFVRQAFQGTLEYVSGARVWVIQPTANYLWYLLLLKERHHENFLNGFRFDVSLLLLL